MTYLWQKIPILMASFLLSVPLAQAQNTPAFQDHPAPIHTGKRQAVTLNQDTQSFKTRFRELQKEPINFAGHYVIGHAGCGGGCVMSMLYNVKTGQTQFLPAVMDCAPTATRQAWQDKDIFYQANSRLLVLVGQQDEEHSPCQQQFFVEQNGQLKLIKTVLLD